MEQLVKGKNIDAENVTVSAPKHLDNGSKLVYVNYNSGRFNIQTPWMDMPWNKSTYTEGPYPKHSMELSFRGMEESEDMAHFHDKMNEVDSKLIDLGVKNSLPWFKKKSISRETVEALYNPIVKVSKDKDTGEPDGKWPSTIRLKIPFRDNRWSSVLVNGDTGDKFDINNSESGDVVDNILVKNAKVRGIIQCVGLWIASGNYMCQWQLVKAEVKVPNTSSGCDFIPDSDDEGDGEATNDVANVDLLDDSEDENVGGGEAVADEEEEEEEEEDEEEEPVVEVVKKPTKKLKVPKKKTTRN